jgi:methionyl-tRNA formyltransferase
MAISIYCLGIKAFIALEKLDKNFHSHINTLVIGRDYHITNDYSEEIKGFAIKNNIHFVFRNQGDTENFNSTHHIALGWKWLIRLESWQKLYVIHDSLLPQYRGFNPLVTALINGDEEIGATSFFADNKYSNDYDTGLIIQQKSFAVNYPCKISLAIVKMADLYADLLLNLVSSIASNQEMTGIAQNETAATYSLWRDKKDYFINWNQSADQIKRLVDAVGDPYDGACFYYNDKIIRVIEANVIDDVQIINRDTGKVFKRVNDNPVIVCGNGLIELVKMIDEDKKELKFEQFRIRL